MVYTTEQAAKAAGVSTVSIWRWVQSGRLPARKIGKRGRLRIDPEVLAMVLDGQRVRVV
jgi:excisionase family DNA binding protein